MHLEPLVVIERDLTALQPLEPVPAVLHPDQHAVIGVAADGQEQPFRAGLRHAREAVLLEALHVVVIVVRQHPHLGALEARGVVDGRQHTARNHQRHPRPQRR